MPMLPKLNIDNGFLNCCPKLRDEEYELLEASIVHHGKALVPILVWGANRIILDGHNRYAICKKHNLPFRIEQMSFTHRTDCIDFILTNQLGRRNLTHEQFIYLVGLRYENEKQRHGGQKAGQKSASASKQKEGENGSAKPQNGHSQSKKGIYHDDKSLAENGATSAESTAEKISEESGVSVATVIRAGKFAGYIETIAKKAGKAVKTAILASKFKLTAGSIKDMAALEKTDCKRVADLLMQGKCDSIRKALDVLEGEQQVKTKQAKPPVHQDKLGIEVPEHLVEIFKDDMLTVTAKQINAILKGVKAFSADPKAAAWLSVEKVVTALNDARNEILNARCHTICGSCNGKKQGCVECRKAGWVPQWRYEELQTYVAGATASAGAK